MTTNWRIRGVAPDTHKRPDPSGSMSVTGLCHVCEAAPASHTCPRCGRAVCEDHWDDDADICTARARGRRSESDSLPVLIQPLFESLRRVAGGAEVRRLVVRAARLFPGEDDPAREELTSPTSTAASGRSASPCSTAASASPPCAPTPGTRKGISGTISRTSASSSGAVAPTTRPTLSLPFHVRERRDALVGGSPERRVRGPAGRSRPGSRCDRGRTRPSPPGRGTVGGSRDRGTGSQ